jgi:hypothetical protein
LKNLELAHYVDRLQDENDELRKMMGWLSGHEPQLRMMMETYKLQDGCGFGSEKIGDSSGEGEEKIGDILAPPKTYHKNAYVPKLNPLLNKLDTNPYPPIFPHSTNDFQNPIKFISTSGKVLFEKESEKPSLEKPIEKLSGEKPNDQPHPMPKPKVVKFHCGYCGKDGLKSEFCFKKKCEERMAKEWANKDKYHPPNGVLEPRVQMPRAKASVRTVPAWGEKKVGRGVAGGVKPVRLVFKPVRPVWRQQGASLIVLLVRSVGLLQEVVVLVVGLESLQVVSLLDVLPLVPNTGMGGVVALRWRGGTTHGLPFVVSVLLQVERVGFRGGVRGGSFDRRAALECANPTFEQMARH